jgi:hypothetical protein
MSLLRRVAAASVIAVASMARSAAAQGNVYPNCSERVCFPVVVRGWGIVLGEGLPAWVRLQMIGSIQAFGEIADLAPSHVRADFRFFDQRGDLFSTLSTGPAGLPLTAQPDGSLTAGFDITADHLRYPLGPYVQRPIGVTLTFTDAAQGGNVLHTEQLMARVSGVPEPATVALTGGGLVLLAGITRRRRPRA